MATTQAIGLKSPSASTDHTFAIFVRPSSYQAPTHLLLVQISSCQKAPSSRKAMVFLTLRPNRNVTMLRSLSRIFDTRYGNDPTGRYIACVRCSRIPPQLAGEKGKRCPIVPSVRRPTHIFRSSERDPKARHQLLTSSSSLPGGTFSSFEKEETNKIHSTKTSGSPATVHLVVALFFVRKSCQRAPSLSRDPGTSHSDTIHRLQLARYFY